VTSAEDKALGAYIRACADEMGLRDWTLTFKSEPLDDSEGAWARCQPTDGEKRATIEVCKEFRTEDADIQRMAIIHELVHCHMASVQFFARNDLSEMLGKSGMLMQQGLERDIEYAVDGIAVAWAEKFPMIGWPK
jgi:hypothetical protein